MTRRSPLFRARQPPVSEPVVSAHRALSSSPRYDRPPGVRKGGRASTLVGINRADLPVLLASQSVGRPDRMGADRLASDSDRYVRRGTLAGGVQSGASISVASRSSVSSLCPSGSAQEVECAGAAPEAAIFRPTIPGVSGDSRIVLSPRTPERTNRRLNGALVGRSGKTVRCLP